MIEQLKAVIGFKEPEQEVIAEKKEVKGEEEKKKLIQTF
jgi:hypothetical protein